MFEVIKSRYIFFLEFICSLFGCQTMRLAVHGSGNKFIHRFFEALKPIFSETMNSSMIWVPHIMNFINLSTTVMKIKIV
jgi:hypothetical protein